MATSNRARGRGGRPSGVRRWPSWPSWVNLVLALGVSAVVMAVFALGAGTVPALGPALDAGRGVWTSTADALLPGSQTLRLPGLHAPVTVSFSAQGTASILAGDDHDLFLALGYVHAHFRLEQMDLTRRLGEGRLAALAGPAAVSSDTFELQLGLVRTAQAEWADTSATSPAGAALAAYAQGVNDQIAQDRTNGRWPALFSLTGVYPRAWTPVDSLVLQGILTQQLDFTTTPLDYAVLARTLGYARTMAWFPVLAVNAQHPYDPGPYQDLGVAPMVAQASVPTPASSGPASVSTSGPASAPISAALAEAAGALLARTRALPAGEIHRTPDSNAWAADGPAVAGGLAMLAGDPHLNQTLPSVWFQVALRSPDLDVTGVSVPGLPGVLIGHNQHIAWSLTDVQNQSTMFYAERTDPARPGQYYWRGAWHRMRTIDYTIRVRGASPVHLAVQLTVHGPIMTQAGQTVAVDWAGNRPSPDVAALLGVGQAATFAQFRAALTGWLAPTQNFVYADDRGNIGAISPGYYPLVPAGATPWLPMPGTGVDDIIGTIPYAAVPQVYDPPGHTVITANQRPVSGAYPYYIGTSLDFFDVGYRVAQISSMIDGRSGMDRADFAAVQNDVHDHLAGLIVPRLLSALGSGALSPTEQAARAELAGWDGRMTASSPAASVWWTFWTDYLTAVFGPWWSAAKVPVHLDPDGLSVAPALVSLDQDLQAWTLTEPASSAFTLPDGTRRTGPGVMRQAFATAVAHLSSTLGGQPGSWAWGRMHARQFPALSQAPALGYGPRASGGDPWTVDAADGGLVSTAGPSWRMIVRFTGPGRSTAEGVYPGGQSENPASPWYADQVAAWWDGRYYPLLLAAAPAGAATWSLEPR